jgi:hypothetical protein
MSRNSKPRSNRVRVNRPTVMTAQGPRDAESVSAFVRREANTLRTAEFPDGLFA